MKGLAITSKGLETQAAAELKKKGYTVDSAEPGIVSFTAKDFPDLCKAAYTLQCSDRILRHLDLFTSKDIPQDVPRRIAKLKDLPALPETFTFRAACHRTGEHDFKSAEIEETAGDALFELFKSNKKEATVNLDKPDVIISLDIIDETCAIGLDLVGFDAKRRDFKVFTTPSSIRGTIAAGLLWFAGFGRKSLLVDPFVGDGTLVIEAALLAADKPVHYYRKDKFAFLKFLDKDKDEFFDKIDDKIAQPGNKVYGFDAAFKYVDLAKKNAKIAGVHKLLYLSRVESEWLDVKLDEHQVDVIATKIPEPTKKIPNNDIHRVYNEFFYQAAYILNPKGCVALIARDPKELELHHERHGFKVTKQQEVWMGEQKLFYVLLIKNSKKV